jgi:hypothetical protein
VRTTRLYTCFSPLAGFVQTHAQALVAPQAVSPRLDLYWLN